MIGFGGVYRGKEGISMQDAKWAMRAPKCKKALGLGEVTGDLIKKGLAE